MESKGKLFGHPIHPILVVYPLGLFSAAVIFDILYLIAGNPVFPTVSFYMFAVGVVGGLLAAVFGFIDWIALPNNSRAKNIGVWHGLGNFVIVVMFAVSWFLRSTAIDYVPSTLALILSFAAVALALITGWIGARILMHRVLFQTSLQVRQRQTDNYTHQQVSDK